MKMETELQELKSVLRSLVVSSPTEMDLRTLLRDFRNMMGENIPLVKFGYRDPLAFIKEQCSDCFVIQDLSSNPVLTLIVPDAVKHIDKFVQKQKVTPTGRFKGKRRSVPEAAFKNSDLIVKTFKARDHQKTECTIKENKELHNGSYRDKLTDSTSNKLNNGIQRMEDSGEVTNGTCSSTALEKFMRKRIPVLSSAQILDSEICLEQELSIGDTDSGKQTLSSNSSNSKRAKLEELKIEVRELIAEVPEGVWCTELMRLYREKYGRELNFSRFGFTSVLSLAYAVEGLRYCVAEHTGELLLLREGAHAAQSTHPARYAPATRRDLPTGDPEDALPGIDFDEDVFPRDCMHIMQSVPAQPLDELAPGAMLEVVLGEVYSPTHFWMLRLGPAHYSAMESLMDEMNVYYRGEGRERVLAGGALRVGHYCACSYLGDWHRAVIVKIIDCDNVKVRHVDYATVESVASRSLKPLLRRWAALPAQAMRARLAGVRPPAAGRRWPWAAAAHFLSLVKERRLVANVVAKDAQEGILEVLLIDTSTDEDVCISTEMCRSGHADSRPDSALGVSACYDSSSTIREDMRSLLSTIADIKPDDTDACSEISASASEVVGRGPRLIKTWECNETDDNVSTAGDRSDYLRLRLAVLRANLVSKTHEQDSDTETEVSSPDSTVRTPIDWSRSDGAQDTRSARDKTVLDGSESVLSAIQIRLQMLHKLKKVVAESKENGDSGESIGGRDETESESEVTDINMNSSPVSRADVRSDHRVSSKEQGSSDGGESVCSAIEARMLKIRRMKEKQQMATVAAETSRVKSPRNMRKFIMVPDRSHIGTNTALHERELTKEAVLKQGHSDSGSSGSSSVASVALSAIEVRLLKQRQLERRNANAADDFGARKTGRPIVPHQ